MKNGLARIKNFLMLSFLLSFVYGCGGGGGGGGSASLGSLFASGGSTGGSPILPPPGGGADALASVHNPEPATFLLLGGGMLAMGYLKTRSRLSSR